LAAAVHFDYPSLALPQAISRPKKKNLSPADASPESFRAGLTGFQGRIFEPSVICWPAEFFRGLYQCRLPHEEPAAAIWSASAFGRDTEVFHYLFVLFAGDYCNA